MVNIKLSGNGHNGDLGNCPTATKFESLPSLKFPSTHRQVHIAFSTSEQEEISAPSLIIFLLKETERVRER